MNKNNILVISGIILVAAFSRLIPHPTNFAPLGAMALFGGYYFTKKWQSFAVTASAWWLADLVLNNVVYRRYFDGFTLVSTSFITVAISLFVIISISKLVIKRQNALSIVTASLLSSVAFFIITNFGTFLEIYPKNWQGLTAAYTAGLPFFKNTILGDICYAGLLFGAYFAISKTNLAKNYIN
jgi:hypothetical protein